MWAAHRPDAQSVCYTCGMKIPDIAKVLIECEHIIAKAVPIIAEPHRRGGYLCIASDSGVIYATARYGEIASGEKAQRYIKLSQEKALRLAIHPEHVSSWQSRDKTADQSGGAIRVGHLIYSFSGLPELWDEACMIALAKAVPMANVDVSYWKSISDASSNPHVGLI